jgi:hypothetical protein
VKITTEVTAQQISDQFVTAFEGGSNYWLKSMSVLPSWYSNPDNFDGKFSFTVKFYTADDNSETATKTITQRKVAEGLHWMALRQPYHFGLLLDDEGDTITADVFLQMVLFHEVVYG